MKRSKQFDQILDECLGRLAGGESVEECVDRYPGHRDELMSLLRVAAATMRAATSVSYRPEAKARGLDRLTSALAQRRERRRRRFRWLGWPTPVARPAVSGLVIALVSTAAIVGTGMASSDSVPGDPLYWVKTKREDISLMIPKSDMSKAREHVRLAGVRGQEMRRLVDRGRLDDAELLIGRMTLHLNASAGLVGVTISTNPLEMPPRHVRSFRRQGAIELVTYLQRDGDILRALFESHLRSMPAADRQRAQQLMHRSELRYRVLIGALQDNGPPRWAFWMTEPPRRRAR